jgi:uncharacterized protein (TIGR02099 family)
MNESPSSPSGLLKAFAIAAKWSLWLLVAFWLVLALAWGALHGWIVPRIGELRPGLELRATRVLGTPVRIGSIAARSEGLVSVFELQDVVLLDPQGREALRLPRVVAALSPQSLWNLGFDQLYVEKPELDIRRAADGKIFVAGLDFSRGAGEDSRAADWLFNQTEFVIRGGMLRWTDELRGAPPLALQGVDLVMRNSARRHAMRLDATPPTEWGDRFSLRGLFRQPLLSPHHGRWREWDGELHADFSRVDLSQLRRHAALGVDVESGRGALRAWADVDKGEITGGVADLVLAGVSTRLGPNLGPLGLDSVSGRLGGKRLAGGFEFETRNLQFQTHEGQRWPGGNVYVNWLQAESDRPAQGELRADKLDLAALSQIATRLPLGTVTHAALSTYAPKGLVETLHAKWQGPLDALQKYTAQGQAVHLEVAARPGLALPNGKTSIGSPGIRGAALEFDLTEAGGKARLQLQHGALELPGVFEDPVLPFDHLSADFQWQVRGEQIAASVSDLKFGNADAQGTGKASWHTGESGGARFPGVLDLQASLEHADGTKVWRYLPLRVPQTARDYVRDSVQAGEASEAHFQVKGELRDFPFGNGRPGVFNVTAKVKNTTFAFVPARLAKGSAQWPALTQLSGELVFDRNSMQVKGSAGAFSNAADTRFKAEAQIPDLHTPTVTVTADVHGPLAEALAIVNGSPLSGLTHQALARASVTGNADVRLRLVLPVAGIDRSQVQGSVTLAGNEVQITPESPQLARARGVVAFNERGFTLTGTQARALGGEVRLEGGSRSVAAGAGTSAEPAIVIRAQGTATAEGLRQAKELGFLAGLAKHASGGAAYNASLAFVQGVPEVVVTTDLQGLALSLPPPFTKAADAVLALRYESTLLREGQAAPQGRPPHLQDQLTLELGRIASIVYIRDISGAEPRVLRGAIAIGLAPGESAPLPEQGVLANVSLANVNLDSWQEVLEAIGGVPGAGGNEPSRAAVQSAPGASGYLPTVLAVRARELTAEGRTLHNVVVGGSREGQTWRANIDANELNGYAEYRQPSGAGAGRLYARLARMAIAASAAREVEALLDEPPGNIPALDIVVDDFELRGKKLGRLEIDAVNRGAAAVARDGAAREWRLNKLNLSMPEGVFAATGNWASADSQALPAAARQGARPQAERRRTVMNFRLDIADSGQMLGRVGMKDVIRRGRGRMEGQVSWFGSPLSLDYPSLSGSFHVNVESGQFLKADPGLAKLLGVLSLQSLPRRLTLDFRDVFSQGFAFDFVRGDVTIEQGIAATNNLQMKGVNAAVLLEGKADLARETQDIKVVVVPEIDASTAALVATAINPIIGAGAFLAQLILRRPLIRAATQEFHIDGTWADPRITKLDRSPSAAAQADTVPENQPAGSKEAGKQ